MSPPAVVARGLVKRFGERAAVDGLSFEVPSGAVTGFVGPNGSGKTTTMRMLLGWVRAERVKLFETGCSGFSWLSCSPVGVG
jgi:ABC-type multidrug transport system ATPase subunit